MDLIPDLGPPHDYGGQDAFEAIPHLRAEFDALGCTTEKVGRYLRVRKDGRECLIDHAVTSFTSLIAARILADKRQTNALLREYGLNVPEQAAFAQDDIVSARDMVARLGTAVVKPADGNKGRGVTVGVTLDTLETAWQSACDQTYDAILVESLFSDAIEARYMVVDGVCVSVVRRIPPHVTGDGRLTVGELVAQKNANRRRNPNLADKPIRMDAHRHRMLATQGMSIDSVPEAGQLVLIDVKAGISTGGEAADITELVHPDMLRVAEQASRIVPGIDVAGFDILAHDHAAPPTVDNYIIIEGNTRPGLGGHIYPVYGTRRNVGRLIAESCLRKMAREEVRPEGFAPAMAKAQSLLDRLSPDLPVTPVATDVPRDAMTVIFGGDTCLGHSYLTEDRWPEPRQRLLGDPAGFFAGLMPFLARSDALVVNLETVLADDPPDIFGGRKSYLGWDEPERTLATLRKVGVDAVTLANNHFMDFGAGPALSTIQLLHGAGIATAGAGQTLRDAAIPLRIGHADGVGVVVFSAFEKRKTYDESYRFYAEATSAGVLGFGSSGRGMAEVISAYRRARPDDMIIFAPHWGGAKNYEWATEKMAATAAEVIAAGADLVMGHGAHAIQELDFQPAGGTVFSLGNFVFNSPGRYAGASGLPYSLVARLQVAKGRARLRLYPVFCDNRVTDFRNRPVTVEEGILIMAVLRSRSGAPDHFDRTVAMGQDERGIYLEHRCPLSSRFGLL